MGTSRIFTFFPSIPSQCLLPQPTALPVKHCSLLPRKLFNILNLSCAFHINITPTRGEPNCMKMHLVHTSSSSHHSHRQELELKIHFEFFFAARMLARPRLYTTVLSLHILSRSLSHSLPLITMI